jgi:hypothetical protein
MMTPRNHWLLAVSLVVMITLPLLLGVGNDKASSQSNPRQDIARMSKEVQAKLKRQYESFQAMTPAQRDKYRSLHHTLNENSAKGRELAKAAQVYRDWLKTLSAWEISELRRETDPKKRIELVRKFKEEHVHEKERRSFGKGSVPYMGRGAGPKLPRDDLIKILELIGERIKLSSEDRKTLESETGLKRLLHIASLALRGTDGRRWPDDTLMKDILTKVSDGRVRRYLSDASKSESRRGSLRRLIAASLFAEMQADLKNRQPSNEQIESFFLELDSRKRDELTGLSVEEAKRRLRFLYMTSHRDEDAPDWSRMRPILMQLMPQWGRRPPFRGSGRYNGNGNGRGERRGPKDGGKFKRAPGDGPLRKPEGGRPPFSKRDGTR